MNITIVTTAGTTSRPVPAARARHAVPALGERLGNDCNDREGRKKLKFEVRQRNRCKVCGRPRGFLPQVRALPHPLAGSRAAGLSPRRDQGELVSAGSGDHNEDDRSHRGYADPDPQRNSGEARPGRGAGFRLKVEVADPQGEGFIKQLQGDRERGPAELAAHLPELHGRASRPSTASSGSASRAGGSTAQGRDPAGARRPRPGDRLDVEGSADRRPGARAQGRRRSPLPGLVGAGDDDDVAYRKNEIPCRAGPRSRSRTVRFVAEGPEGQRDAAALRRLPGQGRGQRGQVRARRARPARSAPSTA